MTTEAGRLLAISVTAIWGASGVLAVCRQRLSAVAGNLLIAVPMGLLTAWPIGRALIDADGYVRQYGRAALHELPLTGAMLALALLAVAASLRSLRRPGWLFIVGWLANAPSLAMLVYLAFWFRVF